MRGIHAASDNNATRFGGFASLRGTTSASCPGAVERDASIINVPAPDGFDEYSKHFASDVHVIENQKEVGTGKSAWKAYLETKRNFGHKVKLVSHGNPIIVAEST